MAKVQVNETTWRCATDRDRHLTLPVELRRKYRIGMHTQIVVEDTGDEIVLRVLTGTGTYWDWHA